MNNQTKKQTKHCIYLNQSKENFSYKKQEHVIPAGLGGIAKLPKGIVSDQANKLFSKYELIALRRTILSINRNNQGPGKRGSLSVDKVTSPQIHLLEATEESQNKNFDAKYAPRKLGFLFMGNSCIIPQILFPIRDDFSFNIPRLITDNISNDAMSSIYEFLFGLQCFIHSKNKEYILVNSELKRDDKYVIIGSHNKKWFINTSLNNKQLDSIMKILEQKPLPEDIPVLITSKSTYRYSYTSPDLINDSMPFIYVKTAFNTLAYFQGQDFVLNPQFDEVRNAIIEIKDTHRFFIRQPIPAWLVNWVRKEVKPKEHFVVINAEKNYIDAYVSFYREGLNEVIRLTNDYSGENFRRGFICNWEKSQERYMNI